MSSVAPYDALGQERYALKTFGFTPGKFAMWLFLASDAMGFVGLIGAYIILRATLPGDAWVPIAGEWSGPARAREPLP